MKRQGTKAVNKRYLPRSEPEGSLKGRAEAGAEEDVRTCEAQCGGGKSSPVITQQVLRVIQARGRRSWPLLMMGTEAEKEGAGP